MEIDGGTYMQWLERSSAREQPARVSGVESS
jgi:hypothetical protein